MYDLFESLEPVIEAAPAVRPGYRLARLEVFNWGTFDSKRNEVHVIPVNGESALSRVRYLSGHPLAPATAGRSPACSVAGVGHHQRERR